MTFWFFIALSKNVFNLEFYAKGDGHVLSGHWMFPHFPWILLKWIFKLEFLLKVVEHWEHLKGFKIRWTSLICFFKWAFLENLALHWPHSWGFNFRWTEFMWFCNISFLVKVKEHLVHLKGLKFKWIVFVIFQSFLGNKQGFTFIEIASISS